MLIALVGRCRVVRLAAYLLVCLGSLAIPAHAAGDAVPAHVDIALDPGDWGDADPHRILLVLRATATELQRYFPSAPGETIHIRHAEGVPMVLYATGAGGARMVQLTARGSAWETYIYEFGHEFCHIEAHYEHRVGTPLEAHQWFEESLCETASLFALRALAQRWQTDPPWPEARREAPLLADYANMLLNEPHRQGSVSLSRWVAGHEELLLHDPYQRPLNEYVANRLLALFETHPQGWASLQYLNAPVDAATPSFDGYLRQWYHAVPVTQRPFMSQLLALFEVAPDVPTAVTASQN